MANKKAKSSGKGKTIAQSTNTEKAPAGYGELLEALKKHIRAAQIKAALSVNHELIALYWHIGKSIVERQRAEGWGKAVVERLSGDLEQEFPGVAGFSARNIWHMRSFYLAYEPTEQKLKQAVSESDWAKLVQPARESEPAILPQAVSEIPWGHNIVLLQKLKDPAVRLWYARQTSDFDQAVEELKQLRAESERRKPVSKKPAKGESGQKRKSKGGKP